MKYTKDEVRASMLLYAVTERSGLKGGMTLYEAVRAALENGVTLLQVREKEMDGEAFLKEAEELRALCADHHVPFIVNDSVEIALECGADGVHVGQDDIMGRDIRSMIGPDRILGITAKTVEQALAAEAAGADYLGVGAVFGSSTKKDAKRITPDMFRQITGAVSIPVVAIGGISADNMESLRGCGADGAAVVSAIFSAEDPGSAAAALRRIAEDVFRK